MDELYREVLIDHYKHPKNFGEIKDSDIHKHDNNPSCGDEMEIYINLDKDKISEIKFKGSGCVISMASASILMDELDGKKIRDVQKMDTDDMLKLLGIDLTPARIKCMMLPLVTIKKGIIEYEARK